MKIWKQLIDALLDHVALGIQELIHRRADRDNDRPRTRNLVWLACEDQQPISESVRQHSVGSIFHEGKPASLEAPETLKVQVINIDLEPFCSKRQDERDADMPGASDNGKIRRLRGCSL